MRSRHRQVHSRLRQAHPKVAAGTPPQTQGPGAHATTGFTLIEVLITMLIAMVMTGIVIYLFGQTQRGTRISLARAQLMLTANTVDSRLRMDAATMVGPDRSWVGSTPPTANPNAGGCLLVIPALREGHVPLPNGQMSENKVRLRSDQLVFMSKRDATSPHRWVSLLPLPQNAPPAAINEGASSSWEARIWYGAVQDGSLTGNEALQAHHWLVGRQAKVLVQDKRAAGLSFPDNWAVTPGGDTASGSLVKPSATAAWPGIKDTALTNAWTDDAYVSQLAMPMSTAEQLDHVNSPIITPNIDLKRLQAGDSDSGVQLIDIANSHLRLFENCSEFVAQWAGDLDKDGKIDTYPAGHPLAGAIVWYPEELHTSAQKDLTTKTRLTGTLLTKYNAIAANPWHLKSFPAGFAPALGSWPNGHFGGGAWPARFQFDYGEADNPSGQAFNVAANIPKPYVFRFDDDQYRLVRYGFRQDGSNYKNRWDGTPLPVGTLHCFPYPPTAGTGMTDGFATYYNGKAAPIGPYPCAAVAMAAAGTNFGDLMGGTCLPADCNTKVYRTAPCTASATGLLVTVGNAAVPTAPGGSNVFNLPGGAMTLALGAAASGTETLWPYYSGGNLVAIRQVDGSILASVAAPAGDATGDTVPLPSAANQTGAMTQEFGPGNNFTVTYTDIWAEYLKTVNSPTQAADSNPQSREDWRMPQSDWPRLIRLRARLHDSQGLVASYCDEFRINGRDNDGDGVVNNPEEGRMSGIWYEYVFSVPYPTDPSPRQH